MKVVKTIFIVLAMTIAIPLILALFTAKEYTVAREVTINRSGTDVFGYVKHLKNQDHYSKWVMADPHMKKNYKGVDGTEGFVYTWDGNDEAGEGAQEIKNIADGETIHTEIRFVRPFKGIANTDIMGKDMEASLGNLKKVLEK